MSDEEKICIYDNYEKKGYEGVLGMIQDDEKNYFAKKIPFDHYILKYPPKRTKDEKK